MIKLTDFVEADFLDFCMELAEGGRLIHFDDLDDAAHLFTVEEMEIINHNLNIAYTNCDDVHAYSLLAFYTVNITSAKSVLEKLGCEYQAKALRKELGLEGYLTFNEFRATRKASADVKQALPHEEITPGTPGLIYDDTYYILSTLAWPDELVKKAAWYLVIGNWDCMSDDLTYLERELYKFARNN